MPDLKGLVAAVQRYSTKDGPGLRTTAFLINCNMRCKWCSNPEAMLPGKKVLYHVNRCQRSAVCAGVAANGSITVTSDGCEIDRAGCTNLLDLPAACNHDAWEIKGDEYTPAEMADILLRDEVFYQTSGGGVTFSGGECLMQHRFVRQTSEFLKKRNVHIAIDTAGLWRFDTVRPALELADLIMLDIKAMDPMIHLACTGVRNEVVLANARRLAAMNKPMIFRMVIVPGMNDQTDDVRRRVEFIASLGDVVQQLDVLKYHRLAMGKYRDLGMEYPIPDVREAEDSDVEWIIDYGASLGLAMTVGG